VQNDKRTVYNVSSHTRSARSQKEDINVFFLILVFVLISDLTLPFLFFLVCSSIDCSLPMIDYLILFLLVCPWKLFVKMKSYY